MWLVTASSLTHTHSFTKTSAKREGRNETRNKSKQNNFKFWTPTSSSSPPQQQREEEKKERKKEMNQQIIPYLTHLILPLPFVWLQLN